MDVVSALRQLRGGGVVRMATREVQRMAKGKKGGGPPAASAKKGAGKMGPLMQKMVAFYESPIPKKYERDEEQMAKDAIIGKEYTRMKQIRHNEWSRKTTMKIKLRDAAIQALPMDLQEEANTEDWALFPLDRHVFAEWPPIPGFNQQSEDKKEK